MKDKGVQMCMQMCLVLTSVMCVYSSVTGIYLLCYVAVLLITLDIISHNSVRVLQQDLPHVQQPVTLSRFCERPEVLRSVRGDQRNVLNLILILNLNLKSAEIGYLNL